MKYSKQAKLEFLSKQSMPQPYDLSNMNDEEKEAYIAHQNVSHFSEGKHHNKVIDGMAVDIGTNFDWSESLYKEQRNVTIDGTSWVDTIQQQHNKAIKDQANAVENLIIPTQSNGNVYDIETNFDWSESLYKE